MAAPLCTARIGNGPKALRQEAHLFGVEHDLGGSREVKVMPVGVGELLLRMAAERADKDPLGGVSVRAIAGPGASIPLGQSQLDPVGGAIDAAMEAPGINKGLQQQQGMAEAGLPIGPDPAFGQCQDP